jgi:hypothetical protein
MWDPLRNVEPLRGAVIRTVGGESVTRRMGATDGTPAELMMNNM